MRSKAERGSVEEGNRETKRRRRIKGECGQYGWVYWKDDESKKVGWTIIRNGRLLERSILGIMELKI